MRLETKLTRLKSVLVDDREMKLIPDINFQKVFERIPSFSFLLQLARFTVTTF